MPIGSGIGVAVGTNVPVGVRLGIGVSVAVPVGAGIVLVDVGGGDKAGAGRQLPRKTKDNTTKVRCFILNFIFDVARRSSLTT